MIKKKLVIIIPKLKLGNGAVLCDKNEKIVEVGNLNLQKEFEVNLTKLSNFVPYLSTKNIALIKMDIEGGERRY